MVSAFLSSCQKEESYEKGLRSKEYILNEFNNSGISGRVLFSENIDSSFNVQISLDSTILDSIHGVNIFHGRIDSPGTVAIPLTAIVGNGASSQSETRDIRELALPDGLLVPVTYDGIINFSGYINVYRSESISDSIVAQADIGRNGN
jgi:hypothetical protein